MKQRKAFTREERRLMIVQAFTIEVYRNQEWEDMTIADIAQKLKITASTKLRIMVNEMVVDGLLLSRREVHPGIAGFRVIYSLPHHKLFELLKNAQSAAYGQKRAIRINTAQGSFLEKAK